MEYSRWIRFDRLEVTSKNLGRMSVMIPVSKQIILLDFMHKYAGKVWWKPKAELESSPSLPPMSLSSVLSLHFCVL